MSRGESPAWLWVDDGGFTAGVVARGGFVIDADLSVFWAIGKSVEWMTEQVCGRGGVVRAPEVA